MNIRSILFFTLLGCTGSSSVNGFLSLNESVEGAHFNIENFKSKRKILLEQENSSDNIFKLKFNFSEDIKSYYIYSYPIEDNSKLSNRLIRKLKYEEIKTAAQDDLYIENNYIIYSIKHFEPNICYIIKAKMKNGEHIWSKRLELKTKKPISKPNITPLDLSKIQKLDYPESYFLDKKILESNFYKNFLDEEVRREIFRVVLKLKSKSDEEIKEKIFSLIEVVDKKSLELKNVLNEESYEMENTPNLLGLNIVANKGLINNTIIPALKEIKNLDINSISREDLEITYIKLIILKIETHRVERSPTRSARFRSEPLKKWNSLRIISSDKIAKKEKSFNEDIIVKRGTSEVNLFSPR